MVESTGFDPWDPFEEGQDDARPGPHNQWTEGEARDQAAVEVALWRLSSGYAGTFMALGGVLVTQHTAWAVVAIPFPRYATEDADIVAADLVKLSRNL